LKRYISLDNKSSLDLKIIIKSINAYGSPSASVEYEEIDGRNGAIIIDNERYNNYTLVAKCSVIIDKDIDSTLRAIKSWLNASRGYRKLYENCNPEHYRMASFNSQFEPEQSGTVMEFSLEFNCKPLMYRIDGDANITVLNGDSVVINNPEDEPAKPIIKIFGSGNGSFLFRESDIEGTSWGEISITGVTESITVDFETKDAYRIVNTSPLLVENMNLNVSDLSLAAFSFPPGSKKQLSIKLIGENFTKMEITPRWCSL